jgi:hypothetical protein
LGRQNFFAPCRFCRPANDYLVTTAIEESVPGRNVHETERSEENLSISPLAARLTNEQPILRRNAMNHINRLEWPTAKDLERVVEPLANYICATDEPRTALLSALKVLFREVEATNRAAVTHFRACLAN